MSRPLAIAPDTPDLFRALDFLPDGVTPDQLSDDYLFNEANESIQMNVNGAGTPVAFRHRCAQGRVCYLYRLNFFIQAAGAITAATFGDLAELTNGLQITLRDEGGTILHDFTQRHRISANKDWYPHLGVDLPFDRTAGIGIVPGRWTFAKGLGGRPIRLTEGQYFEILVSDNLSTLTDYHSRVQSFSIPKRHGQ